MTTGAARSFSDLSCIMHNVRGKESSDLGGIDTTDTADEMGKSSSSVETEAIRQKKDL